MTKEGGPIARMLFEHEVTKDLTNSIIRSTEVYTSTGQPTALIEDIEKYIDYVILHLSKENQRLFAMADMILADQQESLTKDLDIIEKNKLDDFKRTRNYYEALVDKVTLAEDIKYISQLFIIILQNYLYLLKKLVKIEDSGIYTSTERNFVLLYELFFM